MDNIWDREDNLRPKTGGRINYVSDDKRLPENHCKGQENYTFKREDDYRDTIN